VDPEETPKENALPGTNPGRRPEAKTLIDDRGGQECHERDGGGEPGGKKVGLNRH
jgi:hypothetical protein